MTWELDGYVAGPELGHGAAGPIFRARDKPTGADVAIRFLAPPLCASTEFMAGFRADMAQLGVIEHANVAQVYELLEHDGQAALVTQLVVGPSLRALLLRGGALPPAAALYVIAGVLTGLAAIHSRGILHRALRSQSVLIDEDGTVKLVDAALAGPGISPANVAPEVRRGAAPSEASDVYAAYAVLLEALTGVRSPQDGGIPPTLQVALSVGLSDEPEARYPNASVALYQLKLVAASALSPQWYDAGRDIVLGRLAEPPALPTVPVQPLPMPDLAEVPGSPAPFSAFVPRSNPARAATGAAAVTAAASSAPAADHGPPLTPLPPFPPPAAPVRPSTPVAATPAWMDLTQVARPTEAVAPWPPETDPPPDRSRRSPLLRLAAILAALVLVGGGTAWAIASALGPDGDEPEAAITNSHVAMPTTPGPTMPVPVTAGPHANADKMFPAPPAGLHVTSRSVSSVSLDWAPSIDNVKVAGYVLLRNGTKVGTTRDPGYTDSGLTPQTKYQYVVSAFDDAGNVSPASVPAMATTLAVPDVSPPTIPTGLHPTGKSVTSIVLAWNPSHDNVGVAGYEVYRDGSLVANVGQPSFTDNGLASASTHTYRVRAFDTSNNASADSAPTTATTLTAPDTTPPSTPGSVGAIGTSPTTIDISWHPATDNVGVTGYQLLRDGVQIAQVPGTSYTDQGLLAASTYTYTVRAVDAAGNPSGLSGPASATTLPAPTDPPTPDPTTDPPTTNPAPEIMQVLLSQTVVGCTITLDVTVQASGPMNATLDYTVGGVSGSMALVFTTGNLSWSGTLPNPDTTADGTASATAGGKSDYAGWTACVVTPPPTTDDPSPPDTT